MLDRLSRGERIACTAIALAAGGAGAVGVFLDGTNTGGVPVLLALGAFFGYLALTGQRLNSLKIGDNEATFLTRMLRDPGLSEQTKVEVAEQLEHSPGLPSSAQRAVDAVLDTQQQLVAQYRRQARAAIQRLAGSALEAEASLDREPLDWDVLLRPEGGAQVAVEIKHRHRGLTGAEATEMLQLTAGSSSVPLGLIVVNQDVPTGVHYASASATWRMVTWRNRDDDDALAAALQEVLQLARSQG
ncbi:hypothetical protein [Kribbella endophytica]